MNINAPDFFETFDLSKAIVGQVGHGYIGQAVEELFKPFCKVMVFDNAKKLDTLEDVVLQSSVIFIAVPTPMNKDGACHTGIVESVLQDIQNTAVKVERDVEDFIVVIKSTVTPGFTDKMRDRFALRILFSPEFLTEKNSVNDFKTTSRVLLGGELADAAVVYKFFESVWPDRIPENYIDNKHGPVNILHCDSTTAELVKYFTNIYLTTCVMFANEFYKVCEALGKNYDVVKTLALLDKRISPSHLDVPGHDGDFGYGGHCFPKDINSIVHLCNELGIGEKLFSAIVDRNKEIRNNKDWLAMKGRAVIE